MERDEIAVAALGPVVVDEPVPDGAGRVGQKGPFVLFIAEDRLIEREHGDAQLVLVAVRRRGLDAFGRLAVDKAHILLDERVGRLRIGFGRIDLGHDGVFRPYHPNPSILLRG